MMYQRLNVTVGCTGCNSFWGSLAQLPRFPSKLPKDLLELQHGTTSSYKPQWDGVGEETRNSSSAQLTHRYIQTGF